MIEPLTGLPANTIGFKLSVTMAKIRHFDTAEIDAAKAWLAEA